ncbi:hypothetical protein BD289DRAFT_504259 [Coniella lustricola]|uniref:Uncharacterized protein n=1 Tax=Coniella lustricola TaxID=2025994 RepID=A0A2T3AEH6_9PEZI|nr:hypothetical protein BD289DRAFT_504259 [Coniella lustricola]
MNFTQPQTSDDQPQAGSTSYQTPSSVELASDLPSSEQSSSGLRESKDRERQREAQAAFAINAEVAALSPRTSQNAWGGNRAFSFSQLRANATTMPRMFRDSSATSTHRPEEPSNVHTVEQQPPAIDANTDSVWEPSLALGCIDVPNLSAREAARRHMLQWEHIYTYNRTNRPLAALHTISERLASARSVYEQLCGVSELDQHAEDNLPLVQRPSHQQEQIQRRVALLERTLLAYTSGEFDAMRSNITAALEGYQSGRIGFSGYFTLIYAGRIVDSGTCRSWADFTIDRQERLDRYCAQYGEGYLWWEPPLLAANGSGGEAEGARMLAKKCATLSISRDDTRLPVQDSSGRIFRDGACHYKVPLGFKKDDNLRRRQRVDVKIDSQGWSPQGDDHKKQPSGGKETQAEARLRRKRARDDRKDIIPAQPAPSTRKRRIPASIPHASALMQQSTKTLSATEGVKTPAAASTQTGTVADKEAQEARKREEANDSGPTIFFDMILDSGAELPLLLHDDLKLLGFNSKDMNAATVIELDCVGGLKGESLTFELLAGLELHDRPTNNAAGGSSSSAAAASSSSAAIHHHIRSPESHFFPTRVLMLGPDVKAPPFGGFSNNRLSGMLPFLAYYTASAPGNGKMSLGEERAEVLGKRNFPFGQRYHAFRNGHGDDDAGKQQQQHMAKIENAVAKIGGSHLGMQQVTFKYAMESGHVLLEQDTFSDDGRSIKTAMALTESDGTVIRVFQCVPSKKV